MNPTRDTKDLCQNPPFSIPIDTLKTASTLIPPLSSTSSLPPTLPTYPTQSLSTHPGNPIDIFEKTTKNTQDFTNQIKNLKSKISPKTQQEIDLFKQNHGIKISAMTLVKNGNQFDYPFLESIASLLPLADELWINIGEGTDGTAEILELYSTYEPKIKLLPTKWSINEPPQKGEHLLAAQTNLISEKCEHPWCFYLQADEVLHEENYFTILKAIATAPADLEGFAFQYEHFYGSYDIVQYTRRVYRKEVRLFRKSTSARSVGDAQSFRKSDGTKLKVHPFSAKIYHYGWVRSPEKMKEKTFYFDQMYHGAPTQDQAKQGIPHTQNNYLYQKIWGLRLFKFTHPCFMHDRITKKNWHWDFKNSPSIIRIQDLKDIFLDTLEMLFKFRFFEYRCYKVHPLFKKKLNRL